MNYKKKI